MNKFQSLISTDLLLRLSERHAKALVYYQQQQLQCVQQDLSVLKDALVKELGLPLPKDIVETSQQSSQTVVSSKMTPKKTNVPKPPKKLPTRGRKRIPYKRKHRY